MIGKTLPQASVRALLGAAAAGSALGLGFSAAYLAGADAPNALMRARAQALVSNTDVSFSEAALQRTIRGMSPGALAIAQRHDPELVANAALRDRQAAQFAARLERADPAPKAPTVASLMLRPSLGVGRFDVSSRFDLTVIDPLDSTRDLECLTQAVYYEARGESPAGQAAVAQVVLNRVKHPAFPKTVCAVVFQGASVGHGCQFSFACDGSMHDRREPAAWRRAETVAARALSGAVMAEVGKSTHFHTLGLAPEWEQDMIRVAQVGMHVFYRFGHNNAAATQLAAEALHAAPSSPQPVLASFLPTALDSPLAHADSKAPAPKEAPASAAGAPAEMQPAAGPASAKVDQPTA